MNNKTIKRFFRILAAFFFASGCAVADDTEVYFSSGSASNADNPLRSNVLFILDTSGSMTSNVPGTSDSRIKVLKDVMRQVLQEAQDMNIGLMRFTNDDGGPVLFPISSIDARASTVVGEAPDSNPSFSNRITDGANDAEERLSDGTVTTGDNTLEMVDIPGRTGGSSHLTLQVSRDDDDGSEKSSGSASNSSNTLRVRQSGWIGVRFQGVSIPQGATITSADLQFVVSSTKTSTTEVTIWAQDVDDAGDFTNNDDDISSRTRTSASVNWSIPGFSRDNTVTSSDITRVIQEIVDRGGWTSGNDMVLMLKERNNSSNADRRFYSHDKSDNLAPKLNISFGVPAVAATKQLVALRFENIEIPQGARVTGANLALVASASDSDSTSLTIRAEKAGNSQPISSAANNISSRSTTSSSATWAPSAWSIDGVVQTPSNISLESVLQEVVDQADWCGGNSVTLILSGNGLRRAQSLEESPADAPQLNYTYEASTATGCYNKTEGGQVGSGNDDAEENISDGSMNRGSNDLDLNTSLVGVRFQDVAIPQGATILEADLTLSARQQDSADTVVRIKGEDSDSSTAFSSADDDISDRNRTTELIDWDLEPWVTDETYTSPDITAIIQEIVNRPGWATGNALALIVEPRSGDTRAAYSNDGDAARAPRLRIKYASTGGSEYKTVRDRLVEIVNDLPASGNTPIVEVMAEAARYWRGEDVDFGLTRDGSRTARVSHPGSYCSAANNCNGANTNSSCTIGSYTYTTDDYGVCREAQCPGSNSSDSQCDTENIKGTPTYITPFDSTLTCQSNFQVLLTDGEANSSSSAIREAIKSNYLGGTSCMTTNGAGNNYASDERCGVDIAKFLHDSDQNDDLDNDQTVNTYTIAFNLNDSGATQFLADMARHGNGGSDDTGFYSATSADELLSAFTSILLEVKRDPTSIASPALATNAFNRLLSRDEIYFGLFTPSLEASWFGNLKKYKVCVDDVANNCTLGDILDAGGRSAIDSTSKKFKDTSQSYWSDVVDGKLTTKGGAGAEITDYTLRVVYTDTTANGTAPASGTSLDTTGHKIIASNWNTDGLATVRSVVCPTPSTASDSDCASRMMFLLGKSLTDAATDTSDTTRWVFNDVLHSSPTVITYSGSDSNRDGIIDTYYDKVVVATNDGSLHLIDARTGAEDWAFIPQALLHNQPQLLVNQEADHIYGLDMTPQVYIKDVDGDGNIEPGSGDKVVVIVGMRRGGVNLYALDLTATVSANASRVVPKFLWRIEGGTGDFVRLSQTWSKPHIANLKIDGTVTPVLVFGGGYDTALDSGYGTAPTSGNANDGNAIFLVNALTGEKILSISGSDGADIVVPGMNYSITAQATLFDSDGDGFDDRLYIPDTGGQIWRVDIGSNIAPDVPGGTVVGHLADLSALSSANRQALDNRRFFEAAEVAQVVDPGFSNAAAGRYNYVVIGSGYRAHPLDNSVQDRLYAIRDKTYGDMTDGDSNHLADNYPAGTNSLVPIDHDTLIDLTTSTLDAGNANHLASDGWYISLAAGEKMMSAPVILGGAVYATTYNPDASGIADLCSVHIGAAAVIAVQLRDASEKVDWNGDGTFDLAETDTNAIDERKHVIGGGIPSGVVPVYTKKGVVGIVGTESGATNLGVLDPDTASRTYWYDE